MSDTRIFTDQLGRRVEVPFPPRRIVSLVPSQSELLFYLGLEDEVVGITKFCVHPEAQFRAKKRVGGTKTVKFDRIRELQPDLIIGNQEENDRQQVETLSQDYPVWVSDVRTLQDAMDMIRGVGEITDRIEPVTQLLHSLQRKFKELQDKTDPEIAVAYFIWNNPLMVAGGETFIDHMLQVAGFRNVFRAQPRYPEITYQQLEEANPSAILLSSEPFPFKEKHIERFRETCPKAEVLLVDGELFSWYGNRLLSTPDYFLSLRQQLTTRLNS